MRSVVVVAHQDEEHMALVGSSQPAAGPSDLETTETWGGAARVGRLLEVARGNRQGVATNHLGDTVRHVAYELLRADGTDEDEALAVERWQIRTAQEVGSVAKDAVVLPPQDGSALLLVVESPHHKTSIDTLDQLFVDPLPEGRSPIAVWAPRDLTQASAAVAVPRTGVRPGKPPAGRISLHPSKEARRSWVVFDVRDLRNVPSALVSRGRSWERTARETVFHLTRQPDFEAWSTFGTIVVRFSVDGALVFEPNGPDPLARAVLIYDPTTVEGGSPPRDTDEATEDACHLAFVAGLAHAVAQHTAQDVTATDASAEGLRWAARQLHRGYVELSQGKLSVPDLSIRRKVDRDAPFARNRVDAFVAEAPNPLPRLERATWGWIRGPGSAGRPGAQRWSILEDRLLKPVPRLSQVCRTFVCTGRHAELDAVPSMKFGKFHTFDPAEIEALTSIQSLMRSYLRGSGDKPLCFAVFGPPGSGKSFAVKELALALRNEEEQKEPSRHTLTFNLSEFRDRTELVAALHEVHEVHASGTVPLVFFDEFDASLGGQPLGWLKHLLAPMQDGKFLDAGRLHSTGRAIFVFAGGTSHSFERFTNRQEAQDEQFRLAKGPDFVSRVRGYVDVLGPNPAHDDDNAFVLRRAVLLRALMLTSDNLTGAVHADGEEKRVDIDVPLLRALLHVSHYRHGSRSLEALLAMCDTRGHKRFDTSSLPAYHLLDLHVPASEFFHLVARERLVTRMLPTDVVAEVRARPGRDSSWCRPGDTFHGYGTVDLEAVEVAWTTRAAVVASAHYPDKDKPDLEGAQMVWEGKKELDRLSSLDRAADLPTKLLRLGVWIVPGERLTTTGAQRRWAQPGGSLIPGLPRACPLPFDLTAADADGQESRLEHSRWARERRLRGVRGPTAEEHEQHWATYNRLRMNKEVSDPWKTSGDGLRRLGLGEAHGSLVPYEALPPEERRKDTGFLKVLRAYAVERGWVLVADQPADDSGGTPQTV